MATLAQRIQWVADAALNRTSTLAEQTRMVEANDGMTVAQNAAATSGDKARAFLDRMRSHLLNNVKAYEEQSAVAAAQAAAHADVDAGLAETP